MVGLASSVPLGYNGFFFSEYAVPGSLGIGSDPRRARMRQARDHKHLKCCSKVKTEPEQNSVFGLRPTVSVFGSRGARVRHPSSLTMKHLLATGYVL